MENVEFDLSQVFREIVGRMESEGALDRDAYMNLIDEVLEDKIANAELDAGANVKNYSESLQLMWSQAEALLTKTGTDGGDYLVGDEDEAEIPETKDEEDA
ncbi:MAG: hypothetical protein HY421_01080 [Candidatus Kerfeldbacteria bacterium]|nr:hypothetical protein [Candidatus Kerfeldbacteria bacterium]